MPKISTPRVPLIRLIPLVCLLAAGLAFAPPAAAATTFTVNTTSDVAADLGCNAAPGDCTLREAITAANALAGADVIDFDVAGTITLVGSALPFLSSPTLLDGATAPGYTGTPVVRVDGSNLTGVVNGIVVLAPATTVRGLSIGGFATSGSAGIWSANAAGIVIDDNYVGLDVDGTTATPNEIGVYARNSVGTQIRNNVVSGNDYTGVQTEGTTGVVITGNRIGTDASGLLARPNQHGIISQDANATIGTSTSGEGNLVSGNLQYGIWVNDLTTMTTSATLRGNRVGVALDGSALGNGEGIRVGTTLVGRPTSATIGGTGTGEGNVVANSATSGIVVLPESSASIRANRVVGNGGLGIDLAPTGVTPNDPGDADSGPNELQNHPVLTAATTDGASTSIAGTLDSTPSTTFAVDLFSAPSCDASGHGEADVYLGSTTATTDGAGQAAINATVAAAVVGHVVTATATDPTGLTSELSACSTVNAAVDGLVVNTVGDTPADAGCNPLPSDCTLREAITESNATAGIDTISFGVTGTIVLASSLPVVSDPVVIDGTTAPGYAGAPLVEIDATASSGDFGLWITAGGSTVRGLAVGRAPDAGGIGLWSAGGNTIEHSYIGLGLDGTSDHGNVHDGIVVAAGSSSNRILDNVISGNGGYGVWLRGDQGPANSNVVQGNRIGTNAAGTAAVANSWGVTVSSASNQVGGASASERNIISGNLVGVAVGSTSNTIEGNYVGLDLTGAVKVPNTGNGMDVGGTGNTIGGAPGHGNVVAGNGQEGIQVTGADNSVRGNLVGLDATGTVSLGNGTNFRGVNIAFSGAVDNVVTDNTVAGHGVGVQLVAAGAGNVVRANRIGTDITGILARPNRTGIEVFQTVGAVIGGTAPGDGNTIAFNTFNGVQITATSTEIAVLGNTIRSNGNLGIDLSNTNFANGVTPNDAGDADTGGNFLQNHPVLTTASAGTTTTVGGTLSTEANTTYRVEAFANATCDASGSGEAERFLGSLDVTTDGAGQAAISAVLTASTTSGEVVTATATDPDGNTSELSPCTPVTTPTETCSGSAATIVGTAGSDTLTGTDGRDVIVGLGANDAINGLGGGDLICGGDGNDILVGDDGNDILVGGDGHDYVAGGLGSDFMVGELGNDLFFGGPQADAIYGGPGGDELQGGQGHDELHGGQGDDRVFGGQGNDRLLGLAGADLLDGGPQADDCDGGPGTNTFVACEAAG